MSQTLHKHLSLPSLSSQILQVHKHSPSSQTHFSSLPKIIQVLKHSLPNSLSSRTPFSSPNTFQTLSSPFLKCSLQCSLSCNLFFL
ncbi:hypothetical protein ACE6H2_007168 [Prunus campanulata]